MSDESPYDREGETVDVVDDRVQDSPDERGAGEKRYRDEEWLYQQYHLLKKSIREIADDCDVWPKTIQRALDDFGIETRPAVRRPTGPWKDEDWLRDQYVEKQKTTYEIADEQDCDRKTVYNWLVEHGIERRGPGDYPLDDDGDRRYRDEDWLREQYIEKQKTGREIADECGLASASPIYEALDRFGIETRGRSEARLMSEARPVKQTDNGGESDEAVSEAVETETGKRSYFGPALDATVSYLSERSSDDERLISPYRNEEWLRSKYDEHGTVTPIADLCNVDEATIYYWMDRFDIDRTHTGNRNDLQGRELYTDEEWLRAKYDEHGTVAGIVRNEPVDVTASTLKNWMDSFGIERRDAGEVGPEARREKGLMQYQEFLDALIEIHAECGRWPNSNEYDDLRPSGAPSSSKAYQFESFCGWRDAIDDAKSRLGEDGSGCE